MLDGAQKTVRRTVAGVLALMCVTLIFTQRGFVGVSFSDGDSVYLLTMLVPVALSSLLLGILPGLAMGLFSGIALLLHALLMPLDYFELTYVLQAPVFTIVGTALFAVVAGQSFCLVTKRGFVGWRRASFLALACLVASLVFSLVFTIGIAMVSVSEMLSGIEPVLSNVELAMLEAQAVGAEIVSGRVLFQVVGDALITGALAIAGQFLAEHSMHTVGETGLRELFGTRLFIVVLSAFMVVAIAAFASVTAAARGGALRSMRSDVDYLLEQTKRVASYNSEVFDLFFQDEDVTLDDIEKLEEVTSQGALDTVLSGYREDVDGMVVTYVGDYVLGTDTERFKISLDTTIEDIFDDEMLAAIERSKKSATLERVVYSAPDAYSDLVDLSSPGDDAQSQTTRQVGYLTAGEEDGYGVVIICPSSMVFARRNDVVNWMTLTSLALLVSVYALSSSLLDRMVARRIDATNSVLRSITDGDLEARVMPEGAREFWDLSAGINVTVDVLQGWIAEAESRMASELAAGKAIQESALPREFPPFPDIDRFEVFASMNAAREVGGDFYDFFLVGDDCGPEEGRLAFVMADVSGKGVPAALFMMKAKTQIRNCLQSGMELGVAINNANDQLCDGNDADMFVTAWVGLLDYGTGHVDYVNAGHNPPLLRHGGSWDWMTEKSGMPLGLFDDCEYDTYSVDMEVGDQILLYTDGVTEAFSVRDEQYGEPRLERLVRDEPDLHPRELVDSVRASVAAHAQGAEQSDDITLLALELER